MIYNPSQIANTDLLIELASKCDWSVISSDDVWEKGSKTRAAQTYVGPAKSNAIDSESEAIELALAMMNK